MNNKYITTIRLISLSNKYTNWYCQILYNARTRASTRKKAKELCGYVERHHILPESFTLGGEKDKENYAYISAREHFIVHWLLSKMLTGKYKADMVYALNGMKRKNKNQQRYETPITSRVYAKIKEEVAKIHSERMSGRTAWNKGQTFEDEKYKVAGRKNKGRVKTQEEIDKRVAKVTGQKRSIEQRANMVKGMTGIKKGPMPAEEKLKRSLKMKDIPKSKESVAKRKETLTRLAEEGNHHSMKEETCPHCNITMKKLSYARWHGNNCKHKGSKHDQKT